jgi:hypothetical protein
MRPLVIGPEETEQIRELAAMAAANPLTMAVMDLDRDDVSDMMMLYSITLPTGYRVTYSHEIQKPGLCHHLSVSVDAAGRLPHPAAVNMIAEAFGMKKIEDDGSLVWRDDWEDGGAAINVLQPVHPQSDCRSPSARS